MAQEVNTQGYGSPFVKAFLSDGTEVTLELVSFQYKYSEKKDDSCDLVLEYEDPTVIDGKGFEEDVEWTITWGYIQGKKTTRKIYIREINPSYSERGVTIEIYGTCKGSYLKERKEKRMNKGKTLVDVAKVIASDNGLNLIGPEPLYQTDEGDIYAIVHTTKDIEVPTSEHITIDPTTFDVTLQEQVFAKDEARSQYLHTFVVHPEFVQGALSEKALLDEMAAQEPNGPLIIETRDDNLIVKKRPLDSKPVRVFKWQRETRDVVRFKPESRSQKYKNETTNINTGGWDIDKKTYVERNITEGSDYQPRLGSQLEGSPRKIKPRNEKDYGFIGNANIRTAIGIILENPEVSITEGLDFNQDDLKGNNESGVGNKDKGDVPEGQILIVGADYVNAQPGTDEVDIVSNDRTGLDIYLNQTTAIDETAVTLPTGGILDINEYVELVDDLKLDDANQVKNERANAALKMNPATLVAEGDPDIECGQVVTVLGVAKKHSGNYYVEESTHTIKPRSGYMMELALPRNARNTSGSSVGNSASIDQFPNAKAMSIALGVSGNSSEDVSTIAINKYLGAENG